jgi:hypothetical protein
MKLGSRIPLPFILSLALLLAACGGAAAPPATEQPTAAPAPTSAPAAEQPTAAPATSAPAAEQPTAVPATAPTQTTGSSGASGNVTILLIGLPDEDTVDSVTGKPVPGVKKLKEMFDSSHSNIDLNIVNIPWGSGATGYQPKTEAMIQANEACVYMMPGASDFGRRGLLENLDNLIKQDKNFQNAWPGDSLKQWRGLAPGGTEIQLGLPYRGGNRVIHWDAKLFKDWGVEPLSMKPTLDEIEQKASKMTGKNPVTGEQNYGYWYQGKYIAWQFLAIAHAMGANWGSVNPDGSWKINWDTPEYEQALTWLVKMAKYAPPDALAADAMPQGFLTDQNMVAIIPEGEPGYYVLPFVAKPELQQRFRTSYNLKGADGKGGLFIADPLTMAASCENKPAAWEVMKWLAGSSESQRYNFDSGGTLPVIAGGDKAVPELGKLLDAEAILGQFGSTDDRYPWAAAQPRWSLQAAIEGALAGTLAPKQALEQAQKETADWLAQQASQ